jgi:hypothetical protein
MRDQPVARPLPTHRQTSMPSVGFETTIAVFDQTKTFYASCRAATVIGIKRKPRGRGGAAKSCQQVEEKEDTFSEISMDFCGSTRR